MYYYRLYDKQTKNYIHSGYNCRFAKDAKEELLSLLANELDSIDLKVLKQLSLEQITAIYDYKVETSTTKFEDI